MKARQWREGIAFPSQLNPERTARRFVQYFVECGLSSAQLHLGCRGETRKNRAILKNRLQFKHNALQQKAWLLRESAEFLRIADEIERQL